MGKGKKSRKHDDDEWENDIEEIAKEAGIELNCNLEDNNLAQSVSKETKKKKAKNVNRKEELESTEQNTQTSTLINEDSKSQSQDENKNSFPEEYNNENSSNRKGDKWKKKIKVDQDITTSNIKLEDVPGTEAAPREVNDQSIIIPLSEESREETNIKIGVKTAAQKRAEKKERDKKKKEVEKNKKKKRQDNNTDETTINVMERLDGIDISTENTGTDELKATEDGNEKSDGENGKETSKDKKKKKKKKKKDEEQESKKKIKKPGKATILKMQEALEEAKKEEERLQAEAEAKQLALEKAETERLERLRIEQEKKERKKLKEKERKERLKKEGKLLTPAQKEQKRRAEAKLQAMRQQGINVPVKDNSGKTKKVMYGKRKKQLQNQVQAESVLHLDQDKKQEAQIEERVRESHEKEAVGLWNAEDEDVADSWDADEVGVTHAWDKSAKDHIAAEGLNNENILQKQLSAESHSSADVAQEDKFDENASVEESSVGEFSSEESSSEEESSSDEDERRVTPEKIKERARERIEKRKLENEANRNTEKLRAPVICVLGHVDTGKTKILDKIRRTNVQDGEAGGITQQIGATNIPVDKVWEQTKMVREFQQFDLKLPGLLVIDTPGHESFSNLRSRGSNLCDMAILVVDIMHGLEPQTIESINLLKKKQTPFVVALNKIDRIFEWKKSPHLQVEDTINKQKRPTKQEFDERTSQVIGQFAEQGLNAALHYQNPEEKTYISLIPTSAHTGDGMGDLMAVICRLTQTRLAKKLAFSKELESTVMEVKALPGLGTTIDVILVNGSLKEGDTLVTGGFDGAIVSQIRSVLTPQPMRELRVKAQYIHHQTLEAAQGAKLCGKDLDKVLAGSPLYVAHQPDEIEVLKEDVEEFVSSSLKAIKVSDRGVYVQASTLGSLEALLEFLKTSKIPYCGVNIGPVHKKDIMRCSVMLEHEPMFAVVLAFDVKIERDAQEFADKEGVRIFSAEIIYHLFDQFTAYCEEYKQKKRDEFKHLAVYPCKLRVLPQHIFNTRDPIVVGVNIEAGNIHVGTPIVVPSQNRLMLGFLTGIEANHKQLEKASAGQEVCVKIEPVPGEAPKLYGRHFTYEDLLVSRVTRESIDVMKQHFREDMTKSDWQLVIELKKLLDIV